MSINLETLVLELKADTSGAQKKIDRLLDTSYSRLSKLEKINIKFNTRGIDSYSRKVEALGRKLNRIGNVRKGAGFREPRVRTPNIRTPKVKAPKVNHAKARAELKSYFKATSKGIKALHNLFDKPITPSVDHDPLTSLNKHLDLKQSHYKQVQKDFDKPIKANVDSSQAKSELETIKNLQDGINEGLGKHDNREAMMSRIADRTNDRRTLDPFDRKQQRTDGLSRASEIGAKPFEGIITGFFENTGRKLNDYAVESVNGISLDALGTTAGQAFDKKLRQGVDMVSANFFGIDTGLSNKTSDKTQRAETSLLNGDAKIQPLLRAFDEIETVGINLEKRAKAIAKSQAVTKVVHRQQMDSKPTDSPKVKGSALDTTSIDFKMKQAEATTNFFKSIYADFSTARKEFKKLDKQLAKFNSDEVIPQELASSLARSVSKLRELAAQLKRAGATAQEELKSIANDPNITKVDKGVVNRKRGQISRYTNESARVAEVSEKRSSKFPQISNSLKGIAKDVKAGLTNEIEDNLSDVNKAGVKIGKALEKGAKTSLDIHSPSRVFKQIGKFVIEGLDVAFSSANPFKTLEGQMSDSLKQLKKHAAEMAAINPDFTPYAGFKDEIVTTKGSKVVDPRGVAGGLARYGAIEKVEDKGSTLDLNALQTNARVVREALEGAEVKALPPSPSASGGVLARYGAIQKVEEPHPDDSALGLNAVQMSAEVIQEALDGARSATASIAGDSYNSKQRRLRPGFDNQSDREPDFWAGRQRTEAERAETKAKRARAKGRAAQNAAEAKARAARESAEYQAREATNGVKSSVNVDSLSEGLDRGAKYFEDALSSLSKLAREAFEKLPANVQRDVKRKADVMANGAVPDPKGGIGAYDRGHKLLIAEYEDYAGAVRRNAKLATKAGDKVVASYEPKIQQATQRLVDSKSTAEDVAALKEIQNLIKQIKKEQAEVSKEFRGKVAANTLNSVKSQAIESLKASQNGGVSPEIREKAAGYLNQLQSGKSIDPRLALDLQEFFKSVSATTKQVQEAINNLKSLKGSQKIDKTKVAATIKSLRDLGATNEEISKISELLGKMNTSSVDKRALQSTIDNLTSKLNVVTEVGVKEVFTSFSAKFEAAVVEGLKDSKIDAPINGFLDLPGQNASLQDRARLQAKSEAARQARKDAKTDLERRRAANKARRNKERAEAGLGTETDMRRVSSDVSRAGNRTIGTVSEVMGSDPAFIRESLSMIIPTLLSGGSIMSMMTPVVSSVLPAIIPMIPSIIAGFGLQKMLAPVIAKAEQSLLTVQPIKQRLSQVASTEQGLKGTGELDFVKQTASTYGIDLEVAAQQYSQLALAARRTRLEGEPIRDIFEGIAASLGAQQTSGADAALIMNAYSQMVSKGVISMEELRGQLGEKFPLALGIFADAMDTDSAGLIRMISTGSVLAEDVLPKVGKALKAEFGESAKEASNQFIGSINNLNSVKFEFAENFADAYGAIPIAMKGGQAALIGVANDNFQLVNNAINTGIISLVATVATASNMLLSTGKIGNIAAKVTNFTREAFVVGMTSVTPFAMVAFADLVDDVFEMSINPSGNAGTFLNNMVDGFTQLFFAPIENLRTMMNQGTGEFVVATEAIPTLFKGIGESIASLIPKEVMSQVLSLGDALATFSSRVGNNAVQLGVLYVMFQQIGALAGGFLNPQLEKLGGVLKSYGETLKRTLLSSKGLKNLWNNISITSGSLDVKNLKDIRLGFEQAKQAATGFGQVTKATFKAGAGLVKAFSGELILLGLAYAMLSFSKSDLRMPMMEALDAAIKKTRDNVRDLKLAMAELDFASKDDTRDGDRPNQPKQWNAKGYELDPLKLFSDDGFKSDQLELDFRVNAKLKMEGLDKSREEAVEQIESLNEQGQGGSVSGMFAKFSLGANDVVNKLRGIGKESKVYTHAVEAYADTLANVGINSETFFDRNAKAITRTEKHFLNVAKGVKVYSKALSELENQGFTLDNIQEGALPQGIQKKVDDINAIKAQRESLEGERVQVGLMDTDKSKERLGEIDEELRRLSKRRESIQLEIEFAPNQAKSLVRELETTLQALRDSTDFPFAEQQKLIASVTKDLNKAKELVEAIENSELGEALKPPESLWARLNNELKETIRLFEVAASRAKVFSLKSQAALVEGVLGQDRSERDPMQEGLDKSKLGLEELTHSLKRAEALLKERNDKLAGMLTVPDTERNETLRKQIESLKKDIRNDNEKVAKMNLDINNQRLAIVRAEEKIAARNIKEGLSSGSFTADRALGEAKSLGRDKDLATNKKRLELALKGVNGVFLTNINTLSKSVDTLNAYQTQQQSSFDGIVNQFDDSTKDWFLDVIGKPTANFADAIKSVTVEELQNVRKSNSSNLADNPISSTLLSSVESYTSLVNKSKDLQSSIVNQQIRLASNLSASTKALEAFSSDIASKLAEAKNELANLKLEHLGKKIENNILTQLKPGTTGVFKDFGVLLSQVAQDLLGDAKGELSLAEQAQANAKELAQLLDKYKNLKDALDRARTAMDKSKREMALLGKIANGATQSLKSFGVALKEAEGIVRNTSSDSFDSDSSDFSSNPGHSQDSQSQRDLAAEAVRKAAREAALAAKKRELEIATFKRIVLNPGTENNINSNTVYKDLNGNVISMTQYLRNISDARKNGLGAGYSTSEPLVLSQPQAPSETQALISELSQVKSQSLTMKRAILGQDMQNARYRVEDTTTVAMRQLNSQLDSFRESVVSAKDSMNSLAEEFGVKNIFNTEKSGMTDAEIKIEEQKDNLRDIKKSLFESVGLEPESGDILKQKASASNLDTISASETGITDLKQYAQFRATVEKYEAGSLTFADAVIKMSNSVDSTASKLESSRKAILDQERFDAMIDARNSTSSDLDRSAAQANSNPLSGRTRNMRMTKKAELFANETDKLKEIRELGKLLNRNKITASEYADKVKLANDYYKNQGEIIEFNNSYLVDALGALESSFNTLITGFGEIFFNDNREQEKKAKAEEMISYGEKLEALDDKYANDPDLFLKAKENLDLINNSKLDGIKNEFSTIKSAMDLAKEGLLGFVKSMLDSISQVAAKELAAGLIGGIFGSVGGGGAGVGSLIGGAISGFSDGGTVGGNSTPSVGGNVGAALAKEGKDAQVAVVHKGEEILSTRNGDAQFARALKQSGQWEQMKNQTPNFASGGTVGAGSYARAISSSGNQRSSVSNYNSNVVYNLQGNSNELRQSVGQIEAERQRRMKRQYDRNR